MRPDQIVSVAVPRPLHRLFCYRVPPEFLGDVSPGTVVRVPFGKSKTHAFVLGPAPVDLDLKIDLKTLEFPEKNMVLPQDLLDLCLWAEKYYIAPIGELLQAAFPAPLLQFKSDPKKKLRTSKHSLPSSIVLTDEQIEALAVIKSSWGEKTHPAALLHGVTGSGKTEIYIALAREALSRGKGVLFLVPEIALTPQLHERIESGLGETAALVHSAVADGRRRSEWFALAEGTIRVAIGARSAVFSPVRELGLIVIDEEHDPTYKQEDRARYHARDLALVRARKCGAFVVLGSATPSLEARRQTDLSKWSLAKLTRRTGSSRLPVIELIDIKLEPLVEGIGAAFAVKTLEAIQQVIDAGEQAMIFLNRRGYAHFLVCEDCGEVEGCVNCSVSLTVHLKRRILACHVCGHERQIPSLCEKCQGTRLKPAGAGTERLEDELLKFLHGAKLIRLDRDQVTSSTRLERVLDEFRSGKANILLGTQMLVKGHDFPGVTLVVVTLADSLFRWPDYKAPERALQVLSQVSGRAGRRERPGRVLVQTYAPEHPVLAALQGRMSEEDFLAGEREVRNALGYPPFGRLARLRVEHADPKEAQRRAETISRLLLSQVPSRQDLPIESGVVTILGPSEAFLERAHGLFRWDILIKALQAGKVQSLAWSAKKFSDEQRWTLLVDVDPAGVA